MPVKPPRGGSTHVDTDVHTFPKRSSDKDFLPADVPVPDNKVPWIRLDDPKLRSTRPGDDTGPDTILPESSIEVRPASNVAAISAVMHRSLETYRITSAAELPAPDVEGLRIYKNRRYVDVPGSGLVLVAVDPDTGWYRARHPGELLPSGPWMLRDSETGIWHPHSDFSTRTNPLTAKSLDGFHAGLDVSGAQSGSDGVIHHDGKLYVVIHEEAYQVMQDLDASRPEYRVWRLVKPNDPVAADSANIYRASLDGETLAITRSEQNTWICILTGLRGGMDGGAQAHANPFNFHRPWLTGAGPSWGQPPVLVATTRALVRRYFADATDQHADDFIARYGEQLWQKSNSRGFSRSIRD